MCSWTFFYSSCVLWLQIWISLIKNEKKKWVFERIIIIIINRYSIWLIIYCVSNMTFGLASSQADTESPKVRFLMIGHCMIIFMLEYSVWSHFEEDWCWFLR